MPNYYLSICLKTLCGFTLIFLLLQLSGCVSSHRGTHYGADGAPNFHIDISKIPDAVPKVEPRSKYGNPSSYVAVGHRYYVLKSAAGYDQKGIASWYGMKFYKVRTSSGEIYDVSKMTAANKVLPLPVYAQVTNLENHKRIIVKINDRGPFAPNRIIDLSYVAAAKLGMLPRGTAMVEVKTIDPRNPAPVETPPENQPSQQLSSPTTAAPPAPSSSKPMLYVQIGAFGQQSNAQMLAQRARAAAHYPVLIKTASHNGQPLYRVEIGPLPDVDSLDELTQQLQKTGIGKPIAAVE
jgi:rare lipoprotein A